MLNARAECEATDLQPDPGIEPFVQEFLRLHKTLPLEKYFQIIEEFVDNARETLSRVPDPEKRDSLRDHYAQIVEVAIDLATRPSV